tara:strand:- start:1759 stop:2058 length:300 start_codon:yes stop_codon:yes gene_type:complete
MSDKEVNGWSNRETWLVGLWLNDAMFEYFKEQYRDGDIALDEVKDFVLDNLEEIHIEGKAHSGLGQDLLNYALDGVNWRELEMHLNDSLKEDYELREEA